MDRKEVWRLHKLGWRPSKIAAKLEGDRSTVEQILEEMTVQKLKRAIIGGAAIAIVVFLGVLAFLYVNKRSTVDQPKPVRQVVERYLAGRPADRWFLTSAQAQGNEFELLRGLIRETEVRLDHTMQYYRGIPEVAMQHRMFAGKFYISFYTDQFGGTSRHVFQGKPEDSQFNSSFIEVVLYGQGQEHAARINNLPAKYDHEWRALILGAVRFSSQWSAAISLHELEHARLDREGAKSARAPFMSDLWISEELQAHGNVEREVLNEATDGRYIQQLRHIVYNKAQITSLEALHNSITLEDLLSMDEIFEQATQREAALRATQYLFDLGEIWLQGKYSGQELLKLRLANYRLISKI